MALGGSRLRSRLRRQLRRIAAASRSDIVLPDGVDGYVHLETALLRPEGLYVLEILEGEGRLMGGERLAEWTLTGRRRFVFPNPLAALQRKVDAARLAAGAAPLVGLLVIAEEMVMPRVRPRDTLTLKELLARLPALSSDAAVPPDYAEAWSRLEAAPRSEGSAPV